ncbi:MAG: major facilitator transporter [Burkholderiales bacterium]|jgi:MFS family permease|nr:major facilitator transporter [Burkholderiales bacterium]
MKNLLKHSVVKIEPKYYYALLGILAPFLNFLAGITFDLHAPSLPAIANYYNAGLADVKNTISITLLGLALGCLLFGVLLDTFGRRPIILLGLLTYTFASFSAFICSSIDGLLFIRFMQGFAIASVSVGCRTIILDSFTDHKFRVAMLYTSLAYGIGPIFAPFIGGYLQHHFGWKANFIAYGIVSFTLMLMFIVFVAESQKKIEPFSWPMVIKNHKDILLHKAFFPGVIIIGLCQVQLLIYTTTGAFLVENILHKSAIVYGNSALIISSGYLLGTLINRFLIKHFPIHRLIAFGFLILSGAVLLQFCFALFAQMNLTTIVVPIVIVGVSQGFININTFSSCLRLSDKAGVATSLFSAAAMGCGTIGVYIVSHINVKTLLHLAILFGVIALIQAIIFFNRFRKVIMNLEYSQ